jgi:hypothetical protein
MLRACGSAQGAAPGVAARRGQRSGGGMGAGGAAGGAGCCRRTCSRRVRGGCSQPFDLTHASSGVSFSCCSSLTGRCSRGTAASILFSPACCSRPPAARTTSCPQRRAGWLRCEPVASHRPVLPLLVLLLPLLLHECAWAGRMAGAHSAAQADCIRLNVACRDTCLRRHAPSPHRLGRWAGKKSPTWASPSLLSWFLATPKIAIRCWIDEDRGPGGRTPSMPSTQAPARCEICRHWQRLRRRLHIGA